MSWMRNKPLRIALAWCAVALLSAVAIGPRCQKILAAEPEKQEVDALRQLQSQVQQVCRDVMDAVVSVDGASGVIISRDGLILSQWHVSHLDAKGKSYPPDHKVSVVFPDGRETVAKLVGADRECDLSLVQLVGEGPFPFVPADPEAAVDLGDWVLKFGHPGSYQKGRKPVVRLGRVVCRIDTERVSEFISDCHITGGDSGGPFFDLQGRIVGVLGKGTTPPGLVLPQRMVPRVGWFWAATSANRIHTKIESMLRGELTAPVTREFPSLYAEATTLEVDRWTQGRKNLDPWKKIVARSRRSIVRICEGSYQAALGTVVTAGGVIVTKASALPKQPACRLHDGTTVPVTLVAVEPAFDIAILQADADLEPIVWAEDSPPVGSFLASPGHDADSLAVGVVSVAQRDLDGPFPKEIIPLARRAADPPEITGIAVEGRGLVVVSVDGNATLAGLEPADELIFLGTAAIGTEADLADAVRNYKEGDILSAVVIRRGTKMQRSLELDNRQVARKTRRFRAPTIFEHDAPVTAQEYGGPILNLDGAATGVTMARNPGYGSVAIPSDCLRRIVRQHTAKGGLN